MKIHLSLCSFGIVAAFGLSFPAFSLQAENAKLRTPLGIPLPAAGPQVKIEVARKKLRDNMEQQIAEFLKIHNDARAEVGVPPLVWDEEIAAYAQEWAEKIAAEDNMIHRPNGKYGENLAGYLPEYGERPVHGAQMWYEEIKDYNGGVMDAVNFEAGHYTQMIWRKSTKVGFGIAMTKNGMAMLCANYEEAGNYGGEHPYKVDGKADTPPPAAAAQADAPPAAKKEPAKAGAPELGGGESVGGMRFRFVADWITNSTDDTISSVSPEGAASVVIHRKPLPKDIDSPWDKIQENMAKELAPFLPGLTDLVEVSTEHDVFRSGVGMRVVTCTAKQNGKPVDVIVDFARENNVDGEGVVLIIRCIDQGSASQAAAALAVVDSLRFKK